MLGSDFGLGITVSDARPDETLLVWASTPRAQWRVQARVTGTGTDPTAVSLTLPGQNAGEAASATESLRARMTVERPVEGNLSASASGSFSAPTTGPALDAGGAGPVAAPAPRTRDCRFESATRSV